MNEFFHDLLNDKSTFIWTLVILVFITFVFYFYRFMFFEIKVESKVESEVHKQLAAIQEKQKKQESL